MATAPEQPTCFVVMPLARSVSQGRVEPRIDFDSVYHYTEQAVRAEGLDCVRADFHESGGFVHPSMAERLLIAEYVIADLTVSNAAVMYEIGVRDAASNRPSILIAARDHARDVPSTIAESRMLRYRLDDDGILGTTEGEELEADLRHHLRQVVDTAGAEELPILDATAWGVGQRLEHDKTDVFLERFASTSESGERIRQAVMSSDRGAAVQDLFAIEESLLDDPDDVADLDSALLGVFLGYRECKAYRHMVDLFPKMPPELRASPVAREQLAFALNRLAEAKDQDVTGSAASRLRSAALASLDAIDDGGVTAETLAIRGRIYKGWFHAATAAGDGDLASDMLARSIESYEQAITVDMRDYFPGINAVMLRLTRGTPEDMDALGKIVPVVRMAVENAPAAQSDEERYWQIATKLELACAARDWDAAANHLASALRLDVAEWMHETTARNLEAYREIFDADRVAVNHVDALIDGLVRA
ncbi:MAG: TRAFs-binding domain-containing protein [Actinomycetota bacterium]